MDQLVVTDLDGSFWGRDLRCHPSTLAAVATLERHGVPLLIATGRREGSARTGLAANGMQPPAVLLNGALGIDLPTGFRFHSHPFATEDAEHVVAALDAVDLSPVLYTDDSKVRVGRKVSTNAEHRGGFSGDRIIEDPFATARARKVLSFSMLGLPREQIEPAAAALADVNADFFLYEDHLYAGFWSMHIQPLAVTKWGGIQSYLTHSGLRPERIIVIGDGTNDVDMLRNADVSLGVRGGHDEPLAIADHLIDHPDDGGWASVLDHLILES